MTTAWGCGDKHGTPLAPSRPTPSFGGIGDLPGGGFRSEALAISDDGRVIAGRSSSARSIEEGFYKVAGDSLIPLLGPGGTPVGSEPRSLTPTGNVIAGKIVTGSLEAARWVNGAVIAMGDLPGGPHNSAAALVTADGNTIAGTGYSASGAEVFVWKSTTGMVGLGEIAGGAYYSEPFGMTPDAAVIVGKAGTGRGMEAFRWTEAVGFQALGDLPGGIFESIALDVSADGRIVVGNGVDPAGNTQGWVARLP